MMGDQATRSNEGDSLGMGYFLVFGIKIAHSGVFFILFCIVN